MNQHPAPTPAEMYEEHIVPAIFIPWTKLLLEKASPQNADYVLDLACGTGIIARHVAPIVGSSGKVYAVDIDQDMLRVGSSYQRPKGATIDWLQADAIDCGMTDGSVGFVICQQGLQFFAASLGGAVALAYQKFDEPTKEEVCQQYLKSIEQYRDGMAYHVPGEFVIAKGIKPDK